MKNPIVLLSFILLCFSVKAQQTNNITIGQKKTIHSDILGESRTLWVYTPQFTSKQADTTARYPVLFVLDGDAHFYSTVGLIQQLSQANGNGILPEMIVVGIESSNRMKDFTPAVDVKPNIDSANLFTRFLANELIPFVAKNYPTTSYRSLIGHSLGGLFSLDILSNYPTLFNAYVAIEPSLSYKNASYLKQYKQILPKQRLKNIKLFIGTANTLPTGMNLVQAKTDKTDETKPIALMHIT